MGRLKTSTLTGMALVLMTLGAATTTPAFAAENCVRVIGDEQSGEKMSMDPAFQPTNDDAYHLFGVYNRFLNVDDNLDPVPELATSWDRSADGKQWTFKLQPGVKFHDGRDFGAKDVVYTFRRLIDPATASPAAVLLDFLKPAGIEEVDPLTVRFTMEQPIADLPLLLTLKFNLIVPEGSTTEQLKTTGIGTGPFMQQQFVIGNPERILKKNPNYWRAGLPKADCIHISTLSEATTALAAIKSDQADLLFNVAATSVPALKDDENIHLLQSGAGTSYTFSMQIDTPPFDKPQVRQALKAVIDRQAMVNIVMLGFAEPGNDNPVPPAWGSAYTHDVPPQDIEKAKQLLAEAGYPNGIDIDLFTAEGIPGMVKFSEVFQQMAVPAGIRINLINNPADSYWDEIWLKRPFYASGWSIRPPAEGLAVAYTKDAKWNETHWQRDDYDALLNQARTELDPAKRVALYQHAQKMLAEEGGVIVPFFQHQVAAIRANCDGYTTRAQNFNVNYETISCKR
jgi:peptide/nickel transport system substrate-binding protein